MPQFHYTTKWQQARRTVLLAWAKGSLQAVPQSALPLIFAFVAPELPTQPLQRRGRSLAIRRRAKLRGP